MSLHGEVDVLLTVPPFTVLNPLQLKRLAAASERLQLASGEMLIRQGETDTAVYVILDGMAEVSVETETGPRVVQRLVRHAFIGEIAFLDEVPRTASVMATSDLTALRMERDAITRLIGDVPELADSIAAHKARGSYVYD